MRVMITADYEGKSREWLADKLIELTELRLSDVAIYEGKK